MTEDEAKKHACIGPKNCGVSYGDGIRYCEGSTCGMAWRWVPIATPVYSSDYGKEPKQGYCGLAGKP